MILLEFEFRYILTITTILIYIIDFGLQFIYEFNNLKKLIYREYRYQYSCPTLDPVLTPEPPAT